MRVSSRQVIPASSVRGYAIVRRFNQHPQLETGPVASFHLATYIQDSPDRRQNKLLAALRALEGDLKHINNSREVRLQVLAGLSDHLACPCCWYHCPAEENGRLTLAWHVNETHDAENLDRTKNNNGIITDIQLNQQEDITIVQLTKGIEHLEQYLRNNDKADVV